MKQMNNIRVSLVFLMAIIITGCGFHLRGEIVLPELYERVFVVSKGSANVGQALSEALENVGTQIVSSPEAATSVVTVLSSGTTHLTFVALSCLLLLKIVIRVMR